MLNFVFQKIRQKKWMFIGLLIGNLLLTAVAAAGPMYAEAVLQRTLTQDLHNYMAQTGQYPGLIQIKNKAYVKVGLSNVERYTQTVQDMTQALQVPVLASNIRYGIGPMEAEAVSQKETIKADLAAYTDFEDHIEVTHGRLYSKTLGDNNVIEVLVNERTFAEQGLALGDLIEIPSLQNQQGQPFRLCIAGVFQYTDAQDLYWPSNPTVWKNVYVMDAELFQTCFASISGTTKTPYGEWHVVLDYSEIKADRAEEISQVISRYVEYFAEKDVFRPTTVHFQETLEAFVKDAKRLNSTVLILQIPIFVLLAAFIFMVSKQILESEQNEIAVFKSRGASKKQIIWIYVQQSGIVALISLAGGLSLSVLICKLLGGTNDFLSFVQRTALPARIDGQILLYAGAAAVVSVCTMVFPVIRYAGVTIVDHKRKKNRGKSRKWWKLMGLDVILLAVSVYALYQYQGQEEFLSEKFAEGASLDPAIYFCSSIFMVGASLLFLRLLPLAIRLIFWIGKRLWPPAMYASLLRMTRSNDNQGFMVVFLVLAITLGIFSTQMARTINRNAEEKLQYSIGADVVLQEVWDEKWVYNEEELQDDYNGPFTTTFLEPDFDKYLQIEGIESAARVLVDNQASITTADGVLKNTMLMGIHTKDFGQVAWFKDGLLSTHWYAYLNAMSQNPKAILVSANLQEQYGYKLGDVLRYSDQNGNTASGIIYGFVEYWPTYASVTRTLGSDGLYTETDHFLVVAHLSQLQSAWGVTPYEVWLKLTGSSQFLYDYAQQSQTRFAVFEDTTAELIALKNDPVFQGTNGILTIGFIIVLLLCAIGFLIYWILSIRARTLQFGIFRAMGMSRWGILSMLFIEQLFVSGTSICAGVAVGCVASNLYIPLIQIAYAGSDKVLPLENTIQFSDYLRLGVVIGGMLILCMAILSVLISKIRISQALKLGED